MCYAICPKCEQEKSIKDGFSHGKQRFYCKSCDQRFTLFQSPKEIDNAYIVRALQLHLEGFSLRDIEKILGIGRTKIGEWLNEYAKDIPALQENDRPIKVKHLQAETLSSFLGEKKNIDGCKILVTATESGYSMVTWTMERKNSESVE